MRSSAAERAVVVGFGNTLRGDDGLGWRAAEAVAAAMPDISILTTPQLEPELADTILNYDLAVFIDASREGTPGDIRCSPVASSADDSEFSHFLTPAALLAIARQLHGSSPTAHTISVCGEWFDVGDTLSPVVAASLPRVVEMVRTLVLGATGRT